MAELRKSEGLSYVRPYHHADIHGTRDWQDTNLVYEIIQGILMVQSEDPPVRQLIKDLLIDLVYRGLNFTTLGPKLPSPLYSILQNCQDCDDKAQWLSDLLCEKGALIHEREVSLCFIRWCETPQWWRNNENSAWWQHQGQEYEIFKKWREDPYNAWWCQHIKKISVQDVTAAYKIAFKHEDRQLYDILTHLPLPAPADYLLFRGALRSRQAWSWSIVVRHEFDDNFIATWSSRRVENMIHITVRRFIVVGGYLAADAIRDILYLRNKGANMTSRNGNGQTPLAILLASGSSKNGTKELVALLEGDVQKVQELA